MNQTVTDAAASPAAKPPLTPGKGLVALLGIYILLLVLLASCDADKPRQTPEEASAALSVFVRDMTPSRGRGQGLASDSMSVESFGRALQKTKDPLVILRAIDTSQLKGDDLIDWKFAQSILVGRELDQEKYQPWRRDPRMYMTFTGICRRHEFYGRGRQED